MQIRLYENPDARPPGQVAVAMTPIPPPGDPVGWDIGDCSGWPNSFAADARAWACGEYTPESGIGAFPVNDLSPYRLVATWTDGTVVLERDDWGRPVAHSKILSYIGPVPGPILPGHVAGMYRLVREGRGPWVLVLRSGQPLVVQERYREYSDLLVADTLMLEEWVARHAMAGLPSMPPEPAGEYAEVLNRSLNDGLVPPTDWETYRAGR